MQQFEDALWQHAASDRSPHARRIERVNKIASLLLNKPLIPSHGVFGSDDDMKILMDDVLHKDEIRYSIGTVEVHNHETLSVVISHAGSQKGVDTA